jgi:NTE family protein
MKSSYPKIGIALGSGGAKGLAHIGVLKALEFHGIPISFVAGSSIGALLGAYYASNPKVSELEKFILKFNARRGFSLFDPALRGGFIKGEKIEKFIFEMLEGANFNTLKIPFAAVATDLNSAEEVIFSKGDLVKAIRASISVPAIFQPIWYQDKLLADGGLSSPVPDEIVKKMGSDIVIAVNLDRIFTPEISVQSLALPKVPMHSIEILRHNLALHSIKTADVVISPKVPQVGLVGWNYFFNTYKAQELIKAGEDAVTEALPQIKLLIQQKADSQNFVSKLTAFFKTL